MPYLKTFAPTALKTGANIVEDVSRGKAWKDAAFDRVPETISRVAFEETDQSGSGFRRNRRKKTSQKRSAKQVK